MATANSICGRYFGLKRAREGCLNDLSPRERKELGKAKPTTELFIYEDGTFKRQLVEGNWRLVENRITFIPVTFGGETLEGMRTRTEAMGRTFGLSFIFNPFELQITEEGLITPEDGAPIAIEFRRSW